MDAHDTGIPYETRKGRQGMVIEKEYRMRPMRGSTRAALILTAVLLAAAGIPVHPGRVPDLVQFLGRFHPLLVHVPIGCLVALFALESLDLLRKSVRLHHATWFVAWLTAATAVFSAFFGILLSHCGEYAPVLLARHLWLGTSTAVLSIWLVVLKMRSDWREPHGFMPLYHATLLLAMGAMGLAGHYGGSLTHGSDYLTAYMPAGLRSVLGAGTASALAPGQNPAEVAVFDAVIEPVLKEKCTSCHGAEKQEHKLRLDGYDAVMQGGESGSNVVAGSSSGSLLIQSVHLPLGDKKHMPPEGKPQLNADDIALLTWWIDRGASATAKVGELKRTRQVARILHARVGLPDAAGEEIPLQAWAAVEATVKQIGADIGIDITPLAADNPGLQLTVLPGGRPFGDGELAKLLPLKANLIRLSLGGSQISDTGLVHVAQMKNLERLDLSRTAISDAGAASLTGLQRLEYLNLYGTKITDAGLEPLRQLASLRKIYLWQTAVTTNGAAAFQEAFIDEGQLQEWQKQIKELQARVAAMGVEVNTGFSTEPAATNAPAAAVAAAAAAPAGKPINEKCCYTGKPLDPAQFSVFKGVVLGFCCEKCKARFDKDPAGEAAKIPLLAGK
jgi:uncharacterized membrane protein